MVLMGTSALAMTGCDSQGAGDMEGGGCRACAAAFRKEQGSSEAGLLFPHANLL